METTETYSSNNRYWWLMLIIGILSILCGIWVFRNPVESYFALAVYFSIMFILYGIGEIVNAFAGQRYRNWGWGLAVGILDLVIGFILLGNLAWAADLLPYVVGFILMFGGICFIGQSSQMQSFRIPNWGWVLTGGILTLIFAFLIIFHPLFGIFNIIVWIRAAIKGDVHSLLDPVTHPQFLISIAFLGIFCILLSAQFMAYMLAHMEIVQSTIFGNASTAISILAGAILLGEPLTIHHIVCALLILAGVIGLALAPAPAENSGKKLGD